MKNIAIKIISAFAVITILLLSLNKMRSLKYENARLLANQKILLNKSQDKSYIVSDSLNAVKVSGLLLTLKEYKKYRAEDLKLISQLKIKKSDLQKVISSQSETISRLSTNLTDSIRVDTIFNSADTVKCFSYKSKWTDVSGYIDSKLDSINLQIDNRESLKVVETVQYKRFLGFLWKTSKIKDRQVDIISENPNTKIINLEYINIGR